MTLEERRRQLLRAAVQLIAERGHHNVRIVDIARAVGSSTGTVHYHFPGKADVLRAAREYALVRSLERQEACLKKVKGARDRLDRLVELQLPVGEERIAEWSIWLQFWTECAIDPAAREMRDHYLTRWHDSVVKIVDEGISSGEFPESLDAEDFATQLTAQIDGLAIRVLTGATDMSADRMNKLMANFLEQYLT
ncbi:TetR/AcrR family transcriptional regulator [Nocardia rhamnosiphila]